MRMSCVNLQRRLPRRSDFAREAETGFCVSLFIYLPNGQSFIRICLGPGPRWRIGAPRLVRLRPAQQEAYSGDVPIVIERLPAMVVRKYRERKVVIEAIDDNFSRS